MTDKTTSASGDEEKTARAIAALDTMATIWAATFDIRKAVKSMTLLPDGEDRLIAFIKQGHVEGLYAGRTSHEPAPDQYDLRIAAFEAAEEACDNLRMDSNCKNRPGANACIAAIRALIKKEVETGARPAAVQPAKDTRFDPFALVLRDVAELDHAPPDADAGDLLMVSPDELRLIMERHLTEPQPAAAPTVIPTVDELTEIIGEHLTCVYVCGRVWDAWNHDTMNQDDFTEAGETEFPGDVATAIHARLLGAAS